MLLISDLYIDLTNINGDTAIHLAAIGGHTEIVIKLLNAGASIDLKTYKGLTALHLAVMYSHNDTVTSLLEAGANINLRTCNDETALHLAAISGNVSILNILLSKNIDSQAFNKANANALYVAAINGNYDAALLLVNNNLAIKYKVNHSLYNNMTGEDRRLSDRCTLLYKIIADDVKKIDIEDILKSIIGITQNQDIIFSNNYKENYLKIIDVLQKGLLIDSLYKIEVDRINKYAFRFREIKIVLPRLEYLCKRQSIPNALLNSSILPIHIQEPITTLLKSLKATDQDIIAAFEIPLAEILNKLYPSHFPSRLPYSALLNLKDIGSDMEIRQINLKNYKEMNQYQPYNFFFYMIDINNRQEITEMFLEFPIEFKLIFNSLEKLVFNHTEYIKLLTIKSKLESPEMKEKLYANLYHIISNIFGDIDHHSQIINNIENIIKSHSETMLKQQQTIQHIYATHNNPKSNIDDILLKQPKIDQFMVSKEISEGFRGAENARTRNIKDRYLKSNCS